jgi:hypothetical protein
MDVSTFFTRLLQAPKEVQSIRQLDDIEEFDAAWRAIQVGRKRDAKFYVCILQYCRRHLSDQTNGSLSGVFGFAPRSHLLSPGQRNRSDRRPPPPVSSGRRSGLREQQGR